MSSGTRGSDSKVRKTACLVLFGLLWALSAQAQMTVGDNTTLSLAGWLGFGYNGGWQNFGPSAHSTSIIGDLNLNGSYYNPNFLSFNVHPYYNRNQTNSISQTTSNTSGFESILNVFGGSHFPGSVGYSKQFNSAGEAGLPGAGFLSTDGSSQNFTITWSELLPNLPTFTVNFSDYSSSSRVVGAATESSFAGQNLNLTSTYLLKGFQLRGFYNHQNVSFSLPEFLNPNTTSSQSSSSSYGVSAVHKLPLSGSFSASWTHMSYSSDQSFGDNSDNNLNVGIGIVPIRKLSLATNVNYVDNVAGALQQTLVEGGVFAPIVVDTSSSSVSINNQAYYTLGHGFGLNGYVNYHRFSFRGQDYSTTQYGGLVTYRYARPLFGLLYFNFGLFNSANQTGNNNLGFTGNVGLTKKFGRWETNADFSYQQTLQTLIAIYTTSNINYGGYVRRRVNRDLSINGNFRAIHNVLTEYDGNSNRSESFGAGVSWRRYAVTGYYSQAKGSSVLTASGTLAPVPVGPILVPDIMYYNGRSYSISLAAVPIKRLTLTAYYTNVRSQTQSSVYSFNRGDRYNALVEYKFRKMAFRGGFTRTRQDISATSTLPALSNTYFANITRWFNIF
jgi:hypothetical protein